MNTVFPLYLYNYSWDSHGQGPAKKKTSWLDDVINNDVSNSKPILALPPPGGIKVEIFHSR